VNSSWLVALAIVAVVLCSAIRSWFWAQVVTELLEQQATTLEALVRQIETLRKESNERHDVETGKPSAE